MIERGRVAGNYPGRCLGKYFPRRGTHQGNRRQSGGRDSRVVAFFLVSDLSLALIFLLGLSLSLGLGLFFRKFMAKVSIGFMSRVGDAFGKVGRNCGICSERKG